MCITIIIQRMDYGELAMRLLKNANGTPYAPRPQFRIPSGASFIEFLVRLVVQSLKIQDIHRDFSGDFVL